MTKYLQQGPAGAAGRAIHRLICTRSCYAALVVFGVLSAAMNVHAAPGAPNAGSLGFAGSGFFFFGDYSATRFESKNSVPNDVRWSQRDFGGAVITVTRTGGTDGRVLVDYATQDGTATNSQDYISTQGTLTFDDFQTSATFVVPLLDSGPTNGEKTIQLVLSNPRPDPAEDLQNPGVIVPTLANDVSTLTIREILGTNINGGTNFSIEKTRYFVEESPRTNSPFSNAFFVVDVILPAGGPGEVDYDVFPGFRSFYDLSPGSDSAHGGTRTLPSPIFTDGTVNVIDPADYLGGTRRLTFGNGQTRMSITNFVLNDSVVEFNEDFDIILRSVNNQPPIGANDRAKATILYEDPPAGALDREWNPDGVSTTTPRFNTTPGANNIVRAVAVQADQKTVIVGDFTAYNSVPRSRIARINFDGSHDASFNPGTGADGSVDALVIYPAGSLNDGKILIGGGFTAVNNLQRGGVARLNADGSLDSSFNPGSGANGAVRSVAVQSDGRILIAGDFTQYNGTSRGGIARLNNNGSLDASFDPGLGADGAVWSVAVMESLTSRKIFIGGEFLEFNGLYRGGVARLNDNGSVDTTFDAGGGADGPVYAVLPQADGRLLIGGAFSSIDFRTRPNIARLDTAGALDLTFDSGSGANDAVYTLALQADGKPLVGGLFTSFNGTRRMGLTRLFVNGTVDTSFLDTAYNQYAGLIKTYYYEPANYVNGIALQTNGDVMIGGSFTQAGGNSASELQTNRNTMFTGFHWTRSDKRARYNVTRLLGGSTIGPGNVEFVYAENTTDENAGTTSVALRRRDGRIGNVSIETSTADNLAVSTGPTPDYGASSASITWIAPGYVNTNNLSPFSIGEVEEKSFNIPIYDDGQIEGDELLNLSMVTPDGFLLLGGEYIPIGAALGQSSATLNIVDNDFSRGMFSFGSVTYATNEDAGLLRVTVVRTNGSSGQVSVKYLTRDDGPGLDKATAGADYTTTQGTLTFNAGVTSQSFTIPIINDVLVEQDESFSIILTNASGTNMLGPQQTSTLTATAKIIDNDYSPGHANFASTNFNFLESVGVAQVTLVRLGGSVGQLSVTVVATNGSAQDGIDFTATTNTITWVNGDVGPKTFPVTLLDDLLVGGNQTINLRMISASPSLGFGTISNATLTVVEDDAYGTLSFSQLFYDADERGTNVTITVVRTGGVGGTVTVNYAVANGPSATNNQDFVATSGTLTFGPGVIATNFDVSILNNTNMDGERIATLILSSFNPPAAAGVPASAELRIMDDESIGDPAGSLDTSFSPLAGGTNAIYALALQQSDGKLLVGGEFRTLNHTLRNRVGRLNADGTLDPSFNPMSGPNNVVRALAVQPVDGRIVIGGFFDVVNGTNRSHIARLLTDGTVDRFFDPGAGADNPVYAVALHPDGRVAVGGSFTTMNGISRAGIALLENNGTVSAAFNPGTGADGTVFAVTVQPDGKVLIGGDFATVNGISRPRLARLNLNGSVDVTFDPGTGPDGPVRAVTLQADGKILIGGSFTNINGTARSRLARLDRSGALDPAFLNGIEGADADVNAIAMQFDGKIIVAGEFTSFNGVTRNRITRLYRNGKTDPTINFGRGANDLINAAVIQPDRKIVIGGRFTMYDGQPRSYLARLHGGSIAGSGAFEFSTPFFEVTENAGAAVITVLRRGGTTGSATVDYRALAGTATDGADFTSVSGTLSFGEGETAETFSVPILNDFVGEPTETVALVLTNATGGATLGAIPNATLSILNDDSGVGFSSAAYAVNEGTASGTVLITVIRTGATNGTATVNYNTVSGTAVAGQDYFTRSGVLTFLPGQTSQTFLVPIVDDSLIELNETFTVVLSNLTGGGALNISTTTVTIVDNDFQPGMFTFSAPSYSVPESAGTVAITILRTNGSTGAVTVDYATVPGTALEGNDYVGQSGTLVFAEGQTNQTITVTILDDALVEGDESFLVQLSNPSSGTTISGATNVTVTILDEEFGPGSLDRSFDPGTGANDLVHSVAVQSDGKVIVGGAFTVFGGLSRNFVARMEANGSNDLAFDPGVGANGLVSSVAAASGGKVLLAGAFDHVGGVVFNRLARLNADGTPDLLFTGTSGLNAAVNTMITQPDGRILLGGAFSLPTRGINRRQASGVGDSSFSPSSGADGAVHALAVQPDGSVLLGGAFSVVAGDAHRAVARMDGSGLLDTAFSTGAITDGTVFCLAVQTDGKVLVGGDFATSAATNRVRLARLNADGTLDSSFNVGPGANATVYSVGLQSSGQIIVGGDFTRINGTSRNRFARLNADGSVDSSFDPGRGANNTVYSVVVLADDNILLGGSFTEVGGAPRGGVARVLGAAVAQAGFAGFAAAGGQFLLTLTVRPQHTYVLEVSHNLASWTPVVTNTALTSEWHFTDTSMMGSTAKFYRVREVAP